MDFYIVIPAHNEEAFIGDMLQSIVEQSLLPKKVIVVNDASTDGTQEIINSFSEKYSFINSIVFNSENIHQPGSKVIRAFYKGFETLDDAYDIICKFDADLIFPKNYLQCIAGEFQNNPGCGMVGGFCTIKKNGNWILENLTNKDHIRGALKAYRKECFKQIGGLKPSMGWDTVDELIAQFHGWNIITDSSLHVKHLKPTGKVYTKTSKYKQGEAFYKMRYGLGLTLIASAKLASKKNDPGFLKNCLVGYYKAKKQKLDYIVSEKEGEFIRKMRWGKIRKKLGIG